MHYANKVHYATTITDTKKLTKYCFFSLQFWLVYTPNLVFGFLVVEYLRFALKDRQKKTSEAHEHTHALLHNITQPSQAIYGQS